MLGRGIVFDGNVISATGGGEGGTDNYEQLQNKPSINGVTLIGDKSFSDLGLETTTEYEELDSYTNGYYFNIFPIYAGEEVSSPVPNANSKYMILKLEDLQSKKFRVSGYSSDIIYFYTNINPLSEGAIFLGGGRAEGGYNNYVFSTEEVADRNPNYIVFNFTNIGEFEPNPKVELVIEKVGGTTNYNNLSNKPSINGIELVGNKTWADLGLILINNYEELNNYVDNHYFDIFPTYVGEEVSSPVPSANSKYMILKLSDLASNRFRISGYSSDIIYFYTDSNPILTTATFLGGGKAEGGYTDYEFSTDEVADRNPNYIIFNFTNTNEYTPKIELITQSLNQNILKDLTENIILINENNCNLETGYYRTTSSYKLYLQNISDNNRLLDSNEIFYFDKEKQQFNLELFNVEQVDDLQLGKIWTIFKHEVITETIINDSTRIPTSKAVYEALQNIQPSGDSFYEYINDVISLNLNGSVTTSNGTRTLTTGFYMTPYQVLYNEESYDNELANKIFYYNATSHYIIKAFKEPNEIEYYRQYYNNESGWSLINRPISITIPESR